MTADHDAHAAELRRLAPALHDAAGIEWVLCKWPADDRAHGDIDVLVDADLADLHRFATRHGYHYEPDPDPYRLKYVHDDRGTELDVHTDTAWVGVRYLDADWVLATATEGIRAGADVWVPSPEAALCIWAAHDVRSNAISEADAAWCAHLADEADLGACHRQALAHGWEHQFAAFHARVRDLVGAPPSTFPAELSFARSLWGKAGKSWRLAWRGEVARALRETVQYARFDVIR